MNTSNIKDMLKSVKESVNSTYLVEGERYTVVDGDNLTKIARKYGNRSNTDIQRFIRAVVRANRLPNQDIVRVDQVLVIPDEVRIVSIRPGSSPRPQAAPTRNEPPAQRRPSGEAEPEESGEDKKVDGPPSTPRAIHRPPVAPLPSINTAPPVLGPEEKEEPETGGSGTASEAIEFVKTGIGKSVNTLRRDRDSAWRMPGAYTSDVRNQCALVVSSGLVHAGILGGTEIGVQAMASKLIRNGWQLIPFNDKEAKAGDIALWNYNPGTALTQGDEHAMFVQSNNGTITFLGNSSSARVIVSRPFGSAGPRNNDRSHGLSTRIRTPNYLLRQA